MSLLSKAIAKSKSLQPREVEALLELIAADSSTVVSVPEAMKIKAAFKAEGSNLPFFEHPSELVSHVHTLLN
jgi:hypothetical protein